MADAETTFLTSAERAILLEVGRTSIECGLAQGRPLQLDLADYPATLRRRRGSFVTLRMRRELRGCIGSIEAVAPLVEDVAFNAHAAASRDPRFAPLEAGELTDLHIHISILGPLEELVFTSQEDLLQQVRPGVDGLVLVSEGQRATLLPAVWERVSEPVEFLCHLKLKAGLALDCGLEGVQMWRYEVESAAEE